MDIKKISLGKRGIEAVLNPIECEIMATLWQLNQGKVRDVHRRLRKRMALTSVAVTLDRMYKKGVVKRRIESGLGGLHYIYSPATTKEQFERLIVENVVEKLIDNFGRSAVSYFNEKVQSALGATARVRQAGEQSALGPKVRVRQAELKSKGR